MSEIGNLVDYLKRYELKTKIVKQAELSSAKIRSLGVIQLTGRSIDEIELKREEYEDGRGGGHIDSIHFRVTYLQPPAAGSREAATARTRIVKGNKILGMFGGKVIDVEWVGNSRIENALNRDIDLRMMLIDPSCKPEYRNIAIFPSHNPWDLEAVDIISPLGPFAQFNFQIYDIIANHVREEISAH